MKIRSMGAELFLAHRHRRKDGRTWRS